MLNCSHCFPLVLITCRFTTAMATEQTGNKMGMMGAWTALHGQSVYLVIFVFGRRTGCDDFFSECVCEN